MDRIKIWGRKKKIGEGVSRRRWVKLRQGFPNGRNGYSTLNCSCSTVWLGTRKQGELQTSAVSRKEKKKETKEQKRGNKQDGLLRSLFLAFLEARKRCCGFKGGSRPKGGS
jgi:hypothetical protein